MVGGTVGAIAGVVGSNAAGELVNPKSTSNADVKEKKVKDLGQDFASSNS